MPTMTDLPTAKIRPASNWSAIWILPLIALLIGGWLAWRAYDQAGINIQIIFATGEGIQVGKTEGIFKGMPIGKVKTLTLDDTGEKRGVPPPGKMNKEMGPHLKKNTRFWLVKPSVTLAGITALAPPVSGNYSPPSPGDGEPTP